MSDNLVETMVEMKDGSTIKNGNIDVALFNVTPNTELNRMSPQEWLIKNFLEDYDNKPENNDWAVIGLNGLDAMGVFETVDEWSINLSKERYDMGLALTPYEWAIKRCRMHTSCNAYSAVILNPDGSITIDPIWNNSNEEYQKDKDSR